MQETGNNIDPISACPKDYTLSIRVHSDGFCFLVSEVGKTNRSVWALELSNKGISPADCFKRAFEHTSMLQLNYGAVFVLFHTADYTFVPKQFSDLSASSLIGSPKESDTMDLEYGFGYAEEKVVYSVQKELHAQLKRFYPQALFVPHIGALIHHKQPTVSNDAEMFVFVRKQNLDILVFKNKKLCFANTFDLVSPLDVVFFVVSVWKELQIDQSKGRLVVSLPGSIRQEIQSQLQHYFTHLCVESDNELMIKDVFVPFDLQIVHQ